MFYALAAGAVLSSVFAAGGDRERILLDQGWKFSIASSTDPDKDFGWRTFGGFLKAGQGSNGSAAGAGFSDTDWQDVTVPHDWAIETPFVQLNDAGHVGHGSRSIGPRFPETSVGWYRKHLQVGKEEFGRRISLEFEGVFRDSSVFVNGHLVGRNLSGYTPFSCDISDVLNYGGDNVVAVRADASQQEGWFYEGAGIYRNAWLVKKSPLHIPEYGVILRPEVKGTGGILKGSAEMKNDGELAQVVSVRVSAAPLGEKLAVVSQGPAIEVFGGETHIFNFQAALDKVNLWSVDTPNLYDVRVELVSEGNVIDSEKKTIGFRTFREDKDKGLFLNGKPLKILGSCNHQDHAGVGAAIPDALNYWRIAKLKEFGFNAYRCSHNPPTEAVLDACDRLGMIVLDETRILGASGEIGSQFERLIMRDRHHACVWSWSIGNEEPIAGTELAANIARSMQKIAKRLDPTRPITLASNHGNSETGIHSMLYLRGFNYKNISNIDEYRKKHPEQFLYGSEEASTLTTRGIYQTDKEKGYMSAYDVNRPGWGATAEDWWKMFDEREWMAGAFVWTGFDYRGEPTPYAWPCISSHFGVLDTCGFPKDVAHYYRVWWSKKPAIHLFPHWNWTKGKEVEVWVFANGEEVELELNGKSLGRQKVVKNSHLVWKVPYQDGKLTAKSYRGGKLEIQETVETTGAVVSYKLKPMPVPSAAPRSDIGVFEVVGVDSAGREVPTADDLVNFEISGGAKIIGVGNGDPSSHEPDKYIDKIESKDITGWTVSVRKSFKDGDSLAHTGTPGSADVTKEGRTLMPGEVGVYRASFDISGKVQPELSLRVGQVDDKGWVYVNGKLIGTTDNWDQSYSFNLSKVAKTGQNEVVIVCKNEGGQGGLGRGVGLLLGSKPGEWKRHLFNGKAQVIIQSNGREGEIVLKANDAVFKADSKKLFWSK